MLRFLKRWFGRESDEGLHAPPRVKRPARPRSTTADVLSKRPGTEPAARKPKPAPKRRGADTLDFPEDEPDPKFDPYNTGKFDRSARWDRISKTQR